MTQFTPPPAPGEVEAFIGHVVSDIIVAFVRAPINVGRKVGLYQATADLGTCRHWRSLPEVYGTC